MKDTKNKLFSPITKKDWEQVLEKMNKNNRTFGYVDFDRKGDINFFDSDPVIDGVHAMFVYKKNVEEIVNSYKD